MSHADVSGVRLVARTRTSEYHVRPDGIVVQTIVTGGTMTLADARANIELFNQLAEGRKRPVMVEMIASYSTEPGVREYYASPEASEFVLAIAMVTPSAAGRIVGNVFLRLNKPAVPCRMFGSQDDAVAWLLPYVAAPPSSSL